jgi:hypothetical protein
MPLAIVLAGTAREANLFVGILIGIVIGILVGPVLRHWLVVREWNQASREAELTDELLSRLGELPEPLDLDEPPQADDGVRRVRWPTSR